MIEAASDSGAAQVVAPDDGSVIDVLRRGEEGAFARLVDQYHASLRRVARLYIANRAVADEVVQDTWLGVIQAIWTRNEPVRRWTNQRNAAPTLRSGSVRAEHTVAVLSPTSLTGGAQP